MSRQDLLDAAPTLDRLGEALDRVGRAGWPEIHTGLAGYVRERRGRVKATRLPIRAACDLIQLADEVERLADVLEGVRDVVVGFRPEARSTPALPAADESTPGLTPGSQSL